jgi:hypothetical protein
VAGRPAASTGDLRAAAPVDPGQRRCRGDVQRPPRWRRTSGSLPVPSRRSCSDLQDRGKGPPPPFIAGRRPGRVAGSGGQKDHRPDGVWGLPWADRASHLAGSRESSANFHGTFTTPRYGACTNRSRSCCKHIATRGTPLHSRVPIRAHGSPVPSHGARGWPALTAWQRRRMVLT